MTPYQLLKEHPVENADMLEILRRGTACIVRRGR